MKRIFTALAAALLGLTVSCGGQPTNDVIHGPEATGPAVQIPAESAPPGVDQVVWEELTARLTQELSRTGSAAPAVAVPQGAAGSVTDLRLETDGDDTASLDWSYVNLGDYNLDGLVSAADLTPVGIYFECNTESPNWLEASRADGNGDGYIGLADVTVIGQNYQHRVDGYRIETSDNPGNPLGWLPHAAVPFTTAVLNAEGSRLVFSSGEITLWEGMSYRVAPYADIEPQLEYGPGSNLVTWTGNAPEAPLGLQASDGEFVGRIALSWASVPDASYYLVYRDQPDNEIGLTLSPVYEEYVTGDYGAHEYWVRAGNAIGESGLSDGDTGFSGLAAPTGVTATAGLYADRVELSWEPVDGAEGYEVFRDGGAAPAGLIGDASNWDDTEADLLMHGYQVQAVNTLCRSQRSASAQGYKRSSPVSSWNQAGANAQHSYSTASFGPQTPEVKWTKYFNTTAHSSPALSLDETTIHVGSRDNRLHAFDRTTRELLWSFVTTDDVVAQPVLNPAGQLLVGNAAGRFLCINPDGTEAWHYDAPGAVTHRAALADSGAVLFLCGDGSLVCLDAAGSELWTYDCLSPGIGHPVVHSDGNVYFLTEQNLHALDALGNERWVYEDAQGVYGSPALSEAGDIYFTEYRDMRFNVVRLNPAGEMQWRYDLGNTSVCTPVVSSSGMVYAANSMDGFGEGLYAVHAINPDGTQAWTAGRSETFCESEVVIGPAGNIYVISYEYYGLACYSPAGEELWTLGYDCSETTFPVVATDGHVYFNGYDGTLVSYHPDAGDPQVFLKRNPVSDDPEYISGEPVFSADGTTYICGDALRALSPDGTELWSNPNAPMVGAAVDADGNVYAAADSTLLAHNPDGTIRWGAGGLEGDYDSAPVLASGHLYFASGKVVDTDGGLHWETGKASSMPPVVGSNGLAYWRVWKERHGYELDSYETSGVQSGSHLIEESDWLNGLGIDPAGLLRVKFCYGPFFAFDAWLDTQWVYDPNGVMASSYGGLAIGADGTAYWSKGFGQSAQVIAMSADMELLWSAQRGDMSWANLVVDGGGCVYSCHDDGYLYCANPDGSERWRIDLTDEGIRSMSLSPDGTLYVVGLHQNLIAIGDAG